MEPRKKRLSQAERQGSLHPRHQMGIPHSHGFLVEVNGSPDPDHPDDAAADENSQQSGQQSGNPRFGGNRNWNPVGHDGTEYWNAEKPELLRDFPAGERGGDFFHDFIGDIDLVGIARKDADEENGDTADDRDKRSGGGGEEHPADEGGDEQGNRGNGGGSEAGQLRRRAHGFLRIGLSFRSGFGFRFDGLGGRDLSGKAARDDLEEHENIDKDQAERRRRGLGGPSTSHCGYQRVGGGIAEERWPP